MDKVYIDIPSRLDYNRKMLNNRVFVVDGNYYGVIIEIIDGEHFKIKSDKGEERAVNIFNIRAIG